jgi:phosphoenolpyruvate carboxykinase (GTP)
MIPKYEDLRRLFRQVRGEDYKPEDYVRQFTIRVPENLAKMERIEKIYRTISDTPKAVPDGLAAQRNRLLDLQARKGDYVSPLEL